MQTLPWNDIVKHLPEFKELTGIDVKYEIYPEVDFHPKLMIALESKAAVYDMYSADIWFVAQYVFGGYIDPLEPYIEDPKLTDKKWFDLDDFFPASLAAGRFNKEKNKYGEGVQYGLPIDAEGCVLYYRKDLFDAKGVKVPETMDDLMEAAGKLNDPKNKIYGIVNRGIIEQSFWNWSGYMWSYGGEWEDEQGRPTVNSPEAIKATEFWVDIHRKYGPPGMATMGWDEINSAMASGVAAMTTESSPMYPTVMNPEKSVVVDKLGFARFPKGPAGSIPPYYYYEFGINPQSKKEKRIAAWLFMQWAFSKKKCMDTLEFNLPGRKSVWESPECAKKYPETYIDACVHSMENGKAQNLNREFFEVQHVLCVQLAKMLGEEVSVKDGLDIANKEMYDIKKKAGTIS